MVTDFNEMFLEELIAMNLVLGTEFEINDGKIVG